MSFMKIRDFFVVFFVAFSIIGVKAQQKKFAVHTVAFYNLENLFDTINNPNNDEEWLPNGAQNWTSEKYKQKLHNLARVLSEIGTTENPNYWKNRKPYPGYWQQDVHYTINAKIDERTDIVSASEQLIYWNNSPDTLHFVFFHLYQNAFQPGSYCSALHEANDYPFVYGPYEKVTLGTVV